MIEGSGFPLGCHCPDQKESSWAISFIAEIVSVSICRLILALLGQLPALLTYRQLATMLCRRARIQPVSTRLQAIYQSRHVLSPQNFN